MALVAALASDVELLILDEPTAGLDPLMDAVFRECIEEERERGRTVLLSSHILAEVEALCDRVTIIRAGRTVESGTLADLRHLTRTSISAELAGPAPGLGGAPRRARPPGRGQPGALPGRDRRAGRGAAPPQQRGRPQPGQPAADPGGAVPAALPATIARAVAEGSASP